MTSPSPARSKTTPSSGKLSAGRIVKKYQRYIETQEDRFIVPRFHLLGVATVGWFAFAFDTASTSHAAEN